MSMYLPPHSYDASPPFQHLIRDITVFWALGCAVVYPGITAAITWTIEFDVSFGLVLGFFLVWLVVWGAISLLVIQWGLRREEQWWESKAKAEAAEAKARSG
jgi:hypothetical protein